jgi:hypothetical protein
MDYRIKPSCTAVRGSRKAGDMSSKEIIGILSVSAILLCGCTESSSSDEGEEDCENVVCDELDCPPGTVEHLHPGECCPMCFLASEVDGGVDGSPGAGGAGGGGGGGEGGTGGPPEECPPLLEECVDVCIDADGDEALERGVGIRHCVIGQDYRGCEEHVLTEEWCEENHVCVTGEDGSVRCEPDESGEECIPYCGKIGSKSEGWYDGCTNEILGDPAPDNPLYDQCAECEAVCLPDGARGAGYYSSCNNDMLLLLDDCEG